MLISPSYLNSSALAGYIATLEGGLRESGSFRSTGSKGISGGISFSAAKVAGENNSETEDSLSVKDHDHSRLQRLIEAAHKNSEELGWIEIMQPDTDFSDLQTGLFIEWECDVYIPDMIAALSQNEGMGATLRKFAGLRPAADALDLNISGLPSSSEMSAMADLLENFDFKPVVVGDDSDTEWKIAGTLQPEWIRPDSSFEDRVRVIGKVKKIVPEGRWYPLFSLPGMNVMKREERRRLERQGPKDDGEKENFLEGPLVVVDYLAIFI
ncbi:DUF6414 family protein [Corynebacterium glutamicum]|uniref:DUF6414 family protein n=1 Tax=Corynebacterium glutamicum TaxID=1718 RepID=UPI000963D710|nr:hypothetical protein [Corynebacterium glutamicum]OKX86681.1 hypothetical protein AUO96_08585 [Corynebacterium glutamicum]QDX74321.1 hypothetical protein AKL15_00365 [Corynebacterium glutamicum]QDX77079.1 hypothetical protein AKL16_00365 [Corynebacterium glutamicum]TWS37012.1 hypothetical protein AKJ20_01975 [Corynebacterium glutamicum]TWS37802.1 hypothetical protein AKJ19_00205 [Corynebacterium glutamicum]